MINIDQLERLKESLATAAVEQTYQLDPTMQVRYGKAGYDKCLQDTHYHILYLTQALRYNSPQLFTEYIIWLAHLLTGLNVPLQDLRTNLNALTSVLKDQIPDLDEGVYSRYLQPAIVITGTTPDKQDSYINDKQPLSDLCQKYLAALLKGNKQKARQIIFDAVEGGIPARDIYLHVFQVSQREVGRLWQQRTITVGQEHFCSAVTQTIIAQLYPYIFTATEWINKRLVAVCVGDELHEIGLRMICDFLEADGWDTYYMGANVPLDSVINAVREPVADILAISTTLTIHLPSTKAIIDRLHEEKLTEKTKVLVGGYAFNLDPELWRHIGADGFAADAASAITEARRLVGISNS